MGVRYLSYLAVLGLIAAAKPAAAQNCGPLPDCEELGFTDSVDDCAEGDRLNCPFDDTSVLCRKKGVRCEIGSILYNDLNCYDTAPDGLTAVGVVFDAVNKLAVAPDNGKSLPWGPTNGSVPGLASSANPIDFKMLNTNGRLNTEAIVKYYGPGTNYAAGYCNAMVGGLKAGAWFLPSYKDFKQISYYWDKINNGLKAAGWSQLSGTYISSIQYDAENTHRITMPAMGNWSTYKTNKHRFFCATSYGDSSIWKQIEASEPEPDLSVTCKVGDVLYSDLKCYDETPSGLTAIGVVFDTTNRLAISKEEKLLYWGEDVMVTGCAALDPMDCTLDGKELTKKVVDDYGNSSGYAAGYCYNYTTKGTKKGDWFLPNIKELYELYRVKGVIGLAPSTPPPLGHSYSAWSSIVTDDDDAYALDMDRGRYSYTKKRFRYYVYCMIEF